MVFVFIIACQCNGHSSCNEENRCIECDGFTEGKNCENCMKGYYGKALNGGTCKRKFQIG